MSTLLYNFPPAFLLSSFSLSLSNLLKIFPLGLLGITSINSIPPANHLYRLLFASTYLAISRLTILSFSSIDTLVDLTTYARGTSPARSDGTGITAESATDG